MRGGLVSAGLYPEYPPCLARGEFTVLRFGLEPLGNARVTLADLLGLRLTLRRAAGVVLGPQSSTLFDPPLSVDPVVVRRVQKPAPGFVLLPEAGGGGEWYDGQRIDFDLLLLGSTITAAGDFIPLLQRLGDDGFPGGARFELSDASSLGPDAAWRLCWQSPQPSAVLVPTLLRLDQWLEDRWPAGTPLRFEFTTPVRLIAGGRPLRRPRFAQLFPFLLRRVTAMLQVHCALEPVTDPAALLEVARGINGSWKNSRWLDWRTTADHEPVGGLTGVLLVDGPQLETLIWVMLLATLFGVGKGAPYGAGRCRLVDAPDLLPAKVLI